VAGFAWVSHSATGRLICPPRVTQTLPSTSCYCNPEAQLHVYTRAHSSILFIPEAIKIVFCSNGRDWLVDAEAVGCLNTSPRFMCNFD
jgi:hypothetical protein